MTLQAEAWNSLPLENRLLHYHEMSREAQRLAAEATSEARRIELTTLAQNWRLLAQETERTLRQLEPR